MALSHELISQFAKVVNSNKQQNTESTIYGTVVDQHGRKPGDVDTDGNKIVIDEAGGKYIKPDGSDQLIPITENSDDIIQGSTTTNTNYGDRATVLIKDHTATVTGNISSPATNNKEVETKISEFDIAVGDQIQANKGYFKDLVADKANIGNLAAAIISVAELIAKDAEIEKLVADKATIADLVAKKIDTDVVIADYATFKDLEATNAKVGSLDADIADINTLMFGSATGDVLQTTFANAVIALLGDAQIKSAMIANLDVSKINAGTINTNNIKMESEDGRLVIAGNTIQIKDENNTVRVQIGKDASDDYSINIWDAEGNLILSEGGITDKAIKEAIIRDDMVSDTANINAKKLDISSLFSEINDSTETIKSTKVYFDSQQQTLDVAFNEMNTTVTEQGDTIESQSTDISVIQGQIESKIWQQDIDTATNEQNTKYSELEQDLDGFKTTVSETYSTKNEVDKLQRDIDAATEDLANFTNDTTVKFNELQDQIDGSITTWFYEVAPTTSNEPASKWNTNDIKNQHLGDLYYDTITGYCYRWQIENNIYSWQLVKDADVTKALEDAAKAQDTADSKRRVFTSTPVTPYEIGDLWTGGLSGDLKRCKVTRLTGNFYDSDWELATKYTDDTAANKAQSDVNALESRMTTAETSIEQNKQEIILRATKTEVDSIINNLEIGGRNLLRFTGDLPLTYNLETGISSYGTSQPLTKTDDGIRFDVPENGRGGINIPLVYDGVIQNSEIVTISFDYRGTITDIGQFYFLQRTTPNVSVNSFPDAIVSEEEWQHYEYTFSSNYANDRVCYAALLFYMGDTEVGKWIEIKKGSLKLERGDKATDWTPAPEDMASMGDLESATETINKTMTEHVSTINANADSISLSVSSLEASTNDKFNEVNNNFNSLREEVELKVTDESVDIKIQKALYDGTKKVDTGTGIKFDENGMNVNKIDAEGNSVGETNTQITENGMKVNSNITGKPVLEANKDGVVAANLHAKDYLIVGKQGGRSRFEDYGNNRTACFWIGE